MSRPSSASSVMSAIGDFAEKQAKKAADKEINKQEKKLDKKEKEMKKSGDSQL